MNNWLRTLYLLVVLLAGTLLLLHLARAADVDSLALALWRSIDAHIDPTGAVDGDGDTVGDVDYVMNPNGSALLDID